MVKGPHDSPFEDGEIPLDRVRVNDLCAFPAAVFTVTMIHDIMACRVITYRIVEAGIVGHENDQAEPLELRGAPVASRPN